MVTDAQGIARNFVFEVAVQGFKNPATTDTTDPFQIEVRNAANTLIDSSVGLDDTNLKLTASPGGFTGIVCLISQRPASPPPLLK